MASLSPSANVRFKFGQNWQKFLTVLDEDRIREAEQSLQKMLGHSSLQGQSFIDVGSGSGLFSLAALRLGAARVHSFDPDPQSVACTQALKRRYFPASPAWTIESGSALDRVYLTHLGQWDVVYAWGVLHHTGAMWLAMNAVTSLVKPGGQLFISIYNDQGGVSRRWRLVKRFFNLNKLGQALVIIVFVPYFVLSGLLVDLLQRHNPVARYLNYKRTRGMSVLYDWFDWLGGYPFEVARPEEVFDFLHQRGFELEGLLTRLGGSGCNEFVFRKV